MYCNSNKIIIITDFEKSLFDYIIESYQSPSYVIFVSLFNQIVNFFGERLIFDTIFDCLVRTRLGFGGVFGSVKSMTPGFPST